MTHAEERLYDELEGEETLDVSGYLSTHEDRIFMRSGFTVRETPDPPMTPEEELLAEHEQEMAAIN